ncbi:MAG: NF038122 family metalloprotease, partial [Pyrinomonadaceae bacterium]
DFDAVVTHEIGHALGFVSESGGDDPTVLSVWDVFRFRPGTASLGAMATAPRVMAKGGTQVFFDAQPHLISNTNTQTQELGLSTGGPDPGPTDGDGNQSSHWKDDRLGGSARPYIGIMDPTIGSGVRRVITDNDTNALDAFGYAIGGAVGPPPPPPPGPTNDNFSGAITIQGSAGSVSGTNQNATKETGEPDHADTGGASVWYFWTAPATGNVTFDTVGSNYDTTLAAYTGSAVNALTKLAENDDIVLAQNIQSRISFNAAGGVTYRIAIDGFDGSTGNFVLNWSGASATPTPTPAAYSVTGRVADPDGSPLAGVRITLDGPNLTNGFPALPATTDANGNYSFSLLTGGGNYSVRGTDSRYTFGGGPYVFNSISFNQTGVNFTANAPASINGTASIAGSAAPLQGVFVGVYGVNPTRLLHQTTTDATGHWSFSGLTLGQTYVWAFVKSGYTFDPPTFNGVLSSTPYNIGNVIGTATNPIDASDFFVTQHYRDFLGRDPDASGLAFWTNEIESCGVNLGCREAKRINVSAAFFLSIEFQQTGYLVERMYKTAYGDTTEVSTGLAVPIIRRQEFLNDTPLIRGTVVVGLGDWQGQLEANKTAYAQAFVQRQRFTDAFPSALTPSQFVAKLNQNAGGVLTQTQVDSIANEMSANAANDSASSARAVAVRRVAESAELDRVEKSRAFVLMQYYGYLRRNPNDAPENNLNFAGWNFWLTKLLQANGDAVRAEMVKAFIASTEYRQRFGN